MGKTLVEVERIVNELSVSDKQTLLQKLIDETDPVDSEIEKAWIEESKSRLQAMKEGVLELIDEEEAFSQAFSSLNEKD